MDDLRTKLDNLEIKQRDFVYARSKAKTDRSAYIDAGISKGTFYSWDQDLRDYLNELASRLHSERKYKAEMILEDSVEEAAQIKIAGLKARDERIKQSASTEILDRMLGKPKQSIEHTGEGGKPIEIVEVIKADGD